MFLKLLFSKSAYTQTIYLFFRLTPHYLIKVVNSIFRRR